MPDPLARPLWRGRTNVDTFTIAAIEYAEKLADTTFVLTQGSYQSGVAQSAGTHDRGGVIDIMWNWTDNHVRCLRLAGFWAWHRNPSQGDWDHHIHAVLEGHPDLAPSAARQVTAGRAGRNGLASNGPDDGPRVTPHPRSNWWPPKEEDDMAEYAEQLDEIQSTAAQTLKELRAFRQSKAAADRRVRETLARIVRETKDDATRAQVAEVIALLEAESDE